MAGVPSPHLWSFFSPAEALPAFAAAPADVAAKDRILLLAKYAMQNGTSFVDMVRSNQGSNPEYAFLTPGGTNHDFFRWALLATGCGLPVEQPPPQGFMPPPPPQQQLAAAVVPSMQQQQPTQYMPPQQLPPQQQQPFYAGAGPQQSPPMQQQQQPYPGQPGYPQHAMHYQQPPHAGPPPPQQQQPVRPVPPPIAPEVAAAFSQVLDNLSGSKDSIKASQGWFMACATYAPGLAYMMAARAASLQECDKVLHLIYLANEILFKAMQQQQGTAKAEEGQVQLDPAAAAAVTAGFVPAAGPIMAAAYAAAQAAGNTEGSGKLDKMLSFWRDKGVFDAATIGRLQHEMHSSNASGLLLSNYPPPPGAAAAGPPQPTAWGPGGTPTQPPQGPVSGGWGAPSPHMQAAAAQPGWGAPPPTAFQPPPPYPQQQQQQPPGWGAPPPAATPWGSRGAVLPTAVPPPYPGAAAVQPPPQYQYGAPGAVPPPGLPPHQAGPPVPHGVVPHPGMAVGVLPAGVGASLPGGVGGVLPAGAVAEAPPAPGPQPVSSLAFPPGLLPQLCREKSKYAEAYAAIEPIEIDKVGLPPPPEKDAYLKSRLDKFMLELSDYKAGSCRADLEESRAAARAQQGLEPDSDEELALGSTGSRLARRKALGSGAAGFEGRRSRRRALGPVVGGMAEDGTYVGPGGGRGERLGLGAHGSADTTADLGDVYSSYRKLRSTSYHSMIVAGAGVSNMAKGG